MTSDPPPQLPPPGWHADPHEDGLRWWDGQRWTEHVAPPSAPGTEPPKRSLPPFLWIGAAAILVAAAIGAFALTKGGGAESPHEECERIAQSLAADLRLLERTSPAVAGEFGTEVVQLDYEQLSGESLADRCGPAAPPLEAAIDEFADAGRGDESKVLRARQALTIAQREMLSQADDPAAAAADLRTSEEGSLDEVAQERVHTAQIAIETFAAGHGGTYIGATPAALAAIEPVLQTSPLQVGEVSSDSYALTVTSESATTFTVTKRGGEVTFSCSPEGAGACPPGGDWD